jgi:hypothetical protein
MTLAGREVEIVRLPIGDWTTKHYGLYIGCTDWDWMGNWRTEGAKKNKNKYETKFLL